MNENPVQHDILCCKQETCLKEELVRYTFDGSSVMMAKSGGVTQQLQVKIGRPIIVTHCIAHRLELVVLDAVKTSSYLNRL